MPTITIHPNYSPRIIVVDAPDTTITIQELVNLVKDWEDDGQNLSYSKLISASGKEDLGGGVSVGITAQLLNAVLRFAARTVSLDSGTCDTTESTGQFLNDATALFISDAIVYVGCTIFNSSTGEMETVLAINSETQLRTFPLSGNGGLGWTNTNGYIIYPNVLCNVAGGNLVAVDASQVTIEPILQAPNVQAVKTSSSSATLQELDAIQYASYGGAVHIDTVDGTAGTTYPIGTEETPVKSLADALLVAVEKGFDKFHVHGDLTIGATDNIDGYIVEGQGATLNTAKTTITMEDGCSTSGTVYKHCRVEGVQGGECQYEFCVVGAVTNTHCSFYESILVGPVTMVNSSLTVNHTTDLHDCHTGTDGYTLDYNDSPIQQIYTKFDGHLTLTNFTHASANVHFHFSGGALIIDSSCTDGNIHVFGPCQITNNGTATVHDHSINADHLHDLHDEAFGKWILNHNTNTLTLYKADGITALKTFTLTSTEDEVPAYIQRTPV